MRFLFLFEDFTVENYEVEALFIEFSNRCGKNMLDVCCDPHVVQRRHSNGRDRKRMSIHRLHVVTG